MKYFKMFLLIIIVILLINISYSISNKDLDYTIIDKYNILYENGLPESHQILKFNNLNKPVHPITIFISYPNNAQFKSIIQTHGKNTTKIDLTEVPLSDQAFDQLISKISDEIIKPPKDYNKKVFKIHIPDNDTLTLDIAINHNNVDEKLWYINILGSEGGSSFLYESGDYSIYNVGGILWWRRIEIKNSISKDTILRFPHKIEGDLSDVRPVRIQDENRNIIQWGNNFTYDGGNDSLSNYNYSDIDWKLPFNVNNGDKFYAIMGKRVNFTLGDVSSYGLRNGSAMINISVIPNKLNLTIKGSNYTSDEGISLSCSGDCTGCAGECVSGHCTSGGGIQSDYTASWGGIQLLGYKIYDISGTCQYTSISNCASCHCAHNPGSINCEDGPGMISCSCTTTMHVGGNVGITMSFGAPTDNGGAKVANVPLNITMNISNINYHISSMTWMLNNETEITKDIVPALSQGINYLNFTSLTRGQLLIFFGNKDLSPIVNLISPLNNSADYDENITFNCSASDDYELNNITLYTNIDGTWKKNQTKSISGIFDSEIFTIDNIPIGAEFEWNCLAYDNSSQYGWAENNWTIKIRPDNNWVCLDKILCEYQSITSALDGENNTANTIYLKEENYTYTAERSAKYYKPSTAIAFSVFDNIILDCNGAEILGDDTGTGIDVENMGGTQPRNSLIKNCIITNYDMGIYAWGGNNTFDNLTISDCNSRGILTWFVNNISIKNSIITESDAGYGIYFDSNSYNLYLENVNVSHNYKANIDVHSAVGNMTVNNSFFSNSETENCLTASSNAIITNNIFENCLANDAAGIRIKNYNYIKNNTIFNNNIAMLGLDSSNSIIFDNLINTSYDSNFYGLGFAACMLIADNSQNNKILNNTFDSCVDIGIAMKEAIEEGDLINNTISGNIFINTTASSINKDIYIGNSDVINTSIWLNHFYTYGVGDSGAMTDYCVNDEGNFYEENIGKTTINETDCGLVNITSPNGGETISYTPYEINWTRQSSIYPITYYLYYSNNSGANYYYISNTNNLEYNWNIAGFPALSTYLVKIVPYDNYKNGTNDNSTNVFTINLP